MNMCSKCGGIHEVDKATFDAMLAKDDARKAARAEQMPTEKDALRTMMSAYERLKELGWKDGMYAPRDGTMVTVMQVGSTGTFDADFTHGFWNIYDGGDVWPTRSAPPLFKLK